MLNVYLPVLSFGCIRLSRATCNRRALYDKHSSLSMSIINFNTSESAYCKVNFDACHSSELAVSNNHE